MDIGTMNKDQNPGVDHTTSTEDMRIEEGLATEDEFEVSQMIGDTNAIGFSSVDTIISGEVER